MSPVEDSFLFLFDLIGRLVCHQLPQRTLWVGGRYLPVCARDTGAYLGLLFGYSLLFFRREKALGPPNLWITLLMAMPMIVDSGTQWVGLRSSTNELRLITGLLFGIALAPLLVYLYSLIPSSRRVPILREVLPLHAELDDKDRWLPNRALGIGSLVAVASFFAVNSVTGSADSLYYWILSSLITISVVWHILVLPVFLTVLVVANVGNQTDTRAKFKAVPRAQRLRLRLHPIAMVRGRRMTSSLNGSPDEIPSHPTPYGSNAKMPSNLMKSLLPTKCMPHFMCMRVRGGECPPILDSS